MRELIEWIVATWALSPQVAAYVVALVAFLGALAVVSCAALYAGLFIFFERRIGARMMSRIGPNRVGPQGTLQFLADAVKLLLKEDIIPASADRPLFKLAPYLMAMGIFGGFAVLPLSRRLVGSDLNVGLLYILAITSISVVGILMSGWASNSKWALFGGVRSAAQIVSYEIPMGLALLPAVLLSGTMSLQGIIAAQGWQPWNWFVFHSPMTAVFFVIYFISALAEGSRTPFDLPEAESELVSGYNTEYSGFRFGAFFLAEFANTWIMAGLATAVFLGGWRVPFVDLADLEHAGPWAAIAFDVAGTLLFVGKTLPLVFLIIQLRWTLPRVRIDQLMALCWKYLVPGTFVCLFLQLAWMIVLPWESTGGRVLRLLMFGAGLLLACVFVWRVRYNITSAGDEVYTHWAV